MAPSEVKSSVLKRPSCWCAAGIGRATAGVRPASRQVCTASPGESPTSATASNGPPRTAVAGNAIGLHPARSPGAWRTSLAMRRVGCASTAVCPLASPRCCVPARAASPGAPEPCGRGVSRRWPLIVPANLPREAGVAGAPQSAPVTWLRRHRRGAPPRLGGLDGHGPWRGVDARGDLRQALCARVGWEVARLRVDRSALAAIDGDEFGSEEVSLLAEARNGAADLSYGRAVVLAEVGDGLGIGRELLQQPQPCDGAGCLLLQATPRTQAIERAREGARQEIARGIAGAPRSQPARPVGRRRRRGRVRRQRPQGSGQECPRQSRCRGAPGRRSFRGGSRRGYGPAWDKAPRQKGRFFLQCAVLYSTRP